MRILIVGLSGAHIGGSLQRAAQTLGCPARFCDMARGWRHGTLRQKLFWHFLRRRPLRLRAFSLEVVRACETFQPDALISTGMAPLTAEALRACRRQGVCCVNYSTDDPFRREAQTPWFLKALREYNVVVTPRRANLNEFGEHGCKRVDYLPFGYDPDLFYPPTEPRDEQMASDLFFAGNGDVGRVPFLAAALRAQLNVRLYGNYWDRYPETRGFSHGLADIATIRRGVQACRVALCGVRHENRDGNSMRTFEIPAVGACMVAEDTGEHREIFGREGDCVLFFTSPEDMVKKTKWLLAHPEERERLKHNVHRHILAGRHSYADRLKAIFTLLENHP